ncbi:MAG: hypothetical protein ACTHLA_13150 [Asticcacaulis sp.]|uniref:hypothetical protein n=1 Tax=Asticcacaulis sp. TaxID=1872648 RepID=UPI003F7C2BBF
MIDSFRKTWDTLPGTILDVQAPNDTSADALILMTINDSQLVLVVEVKRQVFPRDVREIRWRLERGYGRQFGKPGEQQYIPMIMADAISPGAREDMRRDGTAYFESGGSLFIPAKSAYMLIDKPSEKGASAKAMTTVFEGQRAMVLHAIWETLSDEPWFSVKQIAESSGASTGTVSETLNELERRDWVEAVGAGPNKLRRLTNPSNLLDEWKAYQLTQRPPQMKRYFVPGKIPDIVRQLTDDTIDYEITGEMAGQHYAPYLTKVSTLVCRYTYGQLVDHFLEQIKARPVSEGWNFGMINMSQAVHQLRFHRKEEGVKYASPLQTYLDLLQGSGRSKDLAEHLREQKLKY